MKLVIVVYVGLESRFLLHFLEHFLVSVEM